MGTNFYINTDDGWEHVGKRSAAGPFCYICNYTLTIGGTKNVHMDAGCHKSCPTCGRKVDEAGRFGVSGSLSFCWAMAPEEYAKLPSTASAKNEYGKRMIKKTLDEEIECCRIQITDGIGRDFS